MAICLERFFVFVKPYLEASAILTHIHFVAIGAFQFVHSGLGVYVRCMCFSKFWIVFLVQNVIFKLVFLYRFVMKVVSFPV